MNNQGKKTALIILDGWGHGKDPKRSAITQANTPFVDSLYENHLHGELVTFGEEVGLPEGQMGNSEVGHLNIGAGRVVYQELAKINKAIREKTLDENPELLNAIALAKKKNVPIQLLGLVSDGGVHSHIDHLIALTNIINGHGVRVSIHAILDGRDTDPEGGAEYLTKVNQSVNNKLTRITTVIGRYYAMDRDNRWSRIAKAYHLMVDGKGSKSSDLISSVQQAYQDKLTDEFMEAFYNEEAEEADFIQNGAIVLFYNFRTDRPRQLTIALTQENFSEEKMEKLSLDFYTMTEYSKDFTGVHVLYKKDDLVNTLGEIVANADRSQVRIAETEKYPHVTFFFSGGREEPFPKESRIMVKSPDVATYDLQPEMSAPEVTEKLMQKILAETPDFICLNYANTDMVGHTGVMEAAIIAAETVDNNLAKLVQLLREKEYAYIVIADHGNADIMFNEDGSPHTAHTTNMVPCFIGGHGITRDKFSIKNGKLGDIAPTILSLMKIDIPKEMDGQVLIEAL